VMVILPAPRYNPAGHRISKEYQPQTQSDGKP
jgi:hypothetical protein